jgi:hypothetical protein
MWLLRPLSLSRAGVCGSGSARNPKFQSIVKSSLRIVGMMDGLDRISQVRSTPGKNCQREDREIRRAPETHAPGIS